MKLKGINPLEQHVEKIVLVTVSGVFLIVLASQFLLEPNRVTVSGASVPPGKAFEAAADRARGLRAQMDEAQVELPEIPAVNLGTDFKQRVTSGVAPQATLVSALGPTMPIEAVAPAETQMGPREVAIAQLPAPQPVAAAPYRATIDPTETITTPELAKLLPQQQPFDKAAVSVEAVIDGTAIRSALAGGMPENWWGAGRTTILGVRLERQELSPDGSWGEASEVPPPPGRLDGIKEATSLETPGMIGDLVVQISSLQDEALRPSFYRTIAGPKWEEPHEAGQTAEVQNPQIAALLRQRQSLQRTVEDSRRALENSSPRDPGRSAPPPPTGGGGKGGGGAPGSGQVAPRTQPRDQTDPRRRQIEMRIENAERQIADIDSRLTAMGVDAEGRPLQQQANEAQQPAMAARPVLEDSSVRVWSHDMTVEPGKTYRYRVKAAINNPAYGRGAALVAEQQELASRPIAWTEPSAWGEPVTVPGDRYYHITSASESNQLGPARVQAEVYQFFYGYYRKGTVGLEPGDMLVAQVTLPEASKLPIFDLTQPAGQPQNPQMPQELQPPPGRGGGGRGMEAPPAVLPGRQLQQGQTQTQVVLPQNAKPWDQPIIAAEDVILLDVARQPGASQPVAVMRGRGGQLVRLYPDRDPTGMLAMVAKSAQEGENQGQPVVQAPEERPGLQLRQPETQPQEDPRRGSAPAPGGGGG